MTDLIFIRGLPGSGKSTLAKVFERAGYVHCETDMYFDHGGEYRFDASKLPEAHQWCYEWALSELADGEKVVVSNTFTRIWEMQKYLDLPYSRTVLTCEGNFGNVHGVPPDAIQRMRDRWEVYVD